MTVGELIKELQDLDSPDSIIQNECGFEAEIEIECEPSELYRDKLEVWMRVE